MDYQNATFPEEAMTLNHCFKAGRFILAAALVASLDLVAHAKAQQLLFLVDLNSKTVTELGTLGGPNSYPSGIPAGCSR